MRHFVSFPQVQRRATIDQKRRRNRSNLREGHSSGWVSPPLELLEPRRLLAAGDLDPTFGTGGVVGSPFGSTMSGINSLAIQPDGKIIAAGFTGSDARPNPATKAIGSVC